MLSWTPWLLQCSAWGTACTRPLPLHWLRFHSTGLSSLSALLQPEAGEWEIAAEEVLMGPRIGIGSFGEVGSPSTSLCGFHLSS